MKSIEKSNGKTYVENEPHNLNDLREVISILRTEEPWNKEQTLESLSDCLENETREVVEAIAHKDIENLKEELGDVLMQVLYDADIAEENGWFTFEEVVQGASDKLIRRHPEIFTDYVPEEGYDPVMLWKKMKEKEHDR